MTNWGSDMLEQVISKETDKLCLSYKLQQTILISQNCSCVWTTPFYIMIVRPNSKLS